MAKISIHGNSPEQNPTIGLTLKGWDSDMGNLGCARTSADNDDSVTTYDDPNNTVTTEQVKDVVGEGWNITIA